MQPNIEMQNPPQTVPSIAHVVLRGELSPEADDAWLARFGRPSGRSAEELLRAAGFQRLSELTWRHQGTTYVCSETQLGSHTLVTLSPHGRSAGHGGFLRIASHDLRGPLANVRSYASLLMSPRFGLDDRVRRCVEVIARNAERSLAMSQALFDLWRAEGGTLDLDREWVDAVSLLEQTVAEAKPEQGSPTNVRLEVSAQRDEGRIAADPDRLGAILRALVGNAVARGTKTGLVTIRADARDGGLLVTTEDRGDPLPPETAQRAFDVGHEVPLAGKLDERFALCVGAAFVRAHGGWCGARTDGRGLTQFSFWLPRGEPGVVPAANPH